MLPQHTAAALVSEPKVLALPASVDSIPTSPDQEDHFSMGPIAGRGAELILEGVERIRTYHVLLDVGAILGSSWSLGEGQSGELLVSSLRAEGGS